MQSNPYDAPAGHNFGPVNWAINSAFDAMNFFGNMAGLSKVVYQDHLYGATTGRRARWRFFRAAEAGRNISDL